MMSHPRLTRSAAFAARVMLVVALAIAGGDRALAQGKLEASYTITFARIHVGDIATVLELAAGNYTISAMGNAGGVIRSLISGEAAFAAQGILKDGRAVPSSFTSKIMAADENLDVTMMLNDGTVEKLTVVPPPADNRVPVTDADRRGIIDPLSAFLILRPPATTSGAAGTELSPDICQRTLPIFDGLQRYDLKLAYKRMDKVAAEKGYAGPVVVCSIAYQPIAGHRASTPLIKYLSEGREMEIAFAPIPGTRMLGPFQVSVVSMLANLVIKAERFEATGAVQ